MPEGGAVAPVAELLSGAGLCFQSICANCARLMAGSLLSWSPHNPAYPAHLEEAARPAHSGLPASWAPSHIFKSPCFPVGPPFSRGGGKPIENGLWAEQGSAPVFFWCSLQAGGPWWSCCGVCDMICCVWVTASLTRIPTPDSGFPPG